MCGIAGFTHRGSCSPTPCVESREAARMHPLIADPISPARIESQTVSLGAVRLKIIDLDGGDQPMRARRRRGHRLQRRGLQSCASFAQNSKRLGVRFQSHCDTEVVLRAYVQWGTQSFPASPRHVCVRDLDRIRTPAGACPRSARHQAAVCPSSRRRSVLRLRVEDAVRSPGNRASRRSRRV